MTALFLSILDIFLCPPKVSFENLSLLINSTSSLSFSIIDLMVFDPINIVNFSPRRLRSLSVKMCPLSLSEHICISSTPTNSRFLSIGIDSTVHKKYFALIGIIFSSPVIRATWEGSIFFITLS